MAEADHEVCFSIVRTVAQLGLAAQVWDDVGARACRLVDLPPGAPRRSEALGFLARIPTSEAAARLRDVAHDGNVTPAAGSGAAAEGEPLVGKRIGGRSPVRECSQRHTIARLCRVHRKVDVT